MARYRAWSWNKLKEHQHLLKRSNVDPDIPPTKPVSWNQIYAKVCIFLHPLQQWLTTHLGWLIALRESPLTSWILECNGIYRTARIVLSLRTIFPDLTGWFKMKYETIFRVKPSINDLGYWKLYSRDARIQLHIHTLGTRRRQFGKFIRLFHLLENCCWLFSLSSWNTKRNSIIHDTVTFNTCSLACCIIES